MRDDRSRDERAEEVKTTYRIEQVSEAAWYVQHPTEDDRAYLVDMAQRTCECPDWVCRANSGGFDCKHILALVPEWERITGKRDISRSAFVINGKPTNDSGIIAVKDADKDGDPFDII